MEKKFKLEKILVVLAACGFAFFLGRASRGNETSPSLPVKTPEPEIVASSTSEPTELEELEEDETEETVIFEPTEVEEADETEELDETEEEAKPEKTKKEKKKKKQADAPSNLPVVKKVDEGTVTLKKGNLQLWKKGKVLCSVQIPKALNPCDEYNCYYVDKNNRLVIIQTYQKNGKFKMEYSILANNVAKVLYSVTSDNIFEGYESYIFMDRKGKYRIVEFANRDALYYANFKFLDSKSEDCMHNVPYTKAKSKGTSLITKESISETRFTDWGGYDSEKSTHTVYVWEICFTVKNHGRFYCTIYEPSSGEIEMDSELYHKLTKKFPVEQYEDKLSELILISKDREDA